MATWKDRSKATKERIRRSLRRRKWRNESFEISKTFSLSLFLITFSTPSMMETQLLFAFAKKLVLDPLKLVSTFNRSENKNLFIFEIFDDPFPNRWIIFRFWSRWKFRRHKIPEHRTRVYSRPSCTQVWLLSLVYRAEASTRRNRDARG